MAGDVQKMLKWDALGLRCLGFFGMAVPPIIALVSGEDVDVAFIYFAIGFASLILLLVLADFMVAFATLLEYTKESNRLLKIGVSARSSGKEKKEGSTVASKKVEDNTAKGDTKKDSGEAEPACSQKSEVDSTVKKVHISGPRKGQVICPNCGKTQSAYQESCWNCGALFVFGDE